MSVRTGIQIEANICIAIKLVVVPGVQGTMCSSFPRKKQRHSIAWLTSAALIAADTLLTSSSLPARAEDDHAGPARVASVAGAQDPASFRLGIPPRPTEDDADLKVLLVQNGHRTRTDAAASEDTILVAIASSVPHGVDDDIASQYGLELLERTELTALGLRIIQFRAVGDRPIGPILTDLRNDQRIRRAQHNAQYNSTPQRPPVSSLREAPTATAPKPDDNKRRSDVKRPTVTKVAQKAGPSPKGAVNDSGQQPLRSSRVGDVLSGGL